MRLQRSGLLQGDLKHDFRAGESGGTLPDCSKQDDNAG